MLKFLFIFLFSVPILASSTVLSWGDCVADAKKRNLELQAATATYEAAERQVRAAQSGYWPQISANLSYANDSTSTTTYGASLNASQNIFAGFADQAKVLQAESNLDLARINLEAAKARVSADLKNAFAGLLYAQTLQALTQDIVKRREGNLRLVELRFESGRENRGSVLLSKAYLEQAKYEALQARNDLQTAQSQLAKVLGPGHPEDLRVTGNVPEIAGPQNSDFRLLAASSTEYRQSQTQEKSAQAALSLAEAAYYPSLNLTGSTGVTGPEWFPKNDRWTVGANLAWPLWSGGKEIASAQAAKSSLLAAKLNLGTSLETAVVKTKQTFFNFEESLQKEAVDEAFVAAAILREKIAKEKYNNGLTSFDDWDLIENDLISRQKAQLKSRLERVSAEASWEQLIGKGALL